MRRLAASVLVAILLAGPSGAQASDAVLLRAPAAHPPVAHAAYHHRRHHRRYHVHPRQTVAPGPGAEHAPARCYGEPC